MYNLLDLVTKLVSFNTISAADKNNSLLDHNAGYELCTEFISEYCSKAGFRINHFGSRDRVNLVATRGPNQPKPALALSGHIDTVPYDSKLWNDVFTLKKEKNRYFGLGVTDMKLFLAMAMIAAKSIPEDELTKGLAIYFTHSEEIGCIGAKELVKDELFIPATNIIVGEPTMLQPMCFQKGYIYCNIKISRLNNNGCNHSSDPRELVNVISDALPEVIRRLNEFGLNLKKYKDDHYNPSYATVNIGNIIMPSNAAKNIIPSEVTIEFDIRFMHGQDSSSIMQLLESTMDRTAERINYSRNDRDKISIITETKSSPTLPMATNESCNLAQVAQQIFQKPVGGVSYSSEATLFSNKKNADTIILGPGNIKNAHRHHESIDEEFMNPVHIGNYIKLIRHFCC